MSVPTWQDWGSPWGMLFGPSPRVSLIAPVDQFPASEGSFDVWVSVGGRLG